MQSLFAFEQCSEANYGLAKDLIVHKFSPDLNSMEIQNKKLLKQKQDAVLRLFELKFKGEKVEGNPEDVKDAEYSFLQFQSNQKKDFGFLRKNTILEVEKINGIYLSVLGLFQAFALVAAADKKIDHGAFIRHPFVKAIISNPVFKKEGARNRALWDDKMDKVRSWFKDVLKTDRGYLAFIESEETPDKQKAITRHILRKIILADTPIGDFFANEDIRWAEDKDIVKSMVEKTMKSLEATTGEIEIQKLSLEWEEDREFMDLLFDKAVHLPETLKGLIGKHTINWEVSRLALTDRVILQMAIAEMTAFPNIPVKVTINEYIELTKQYSTPKSKQFINGILDVISKELKSSGLMKKSGRGLIDNK